MFLFFLLEKTSEGGEEVKILKNCRADIQKIDLIGRLWYFTGVIFIKVFPNVYIKLKILY